MSCGRNRNSSVELLWHIYKRLIVHPPAALDDMLAQCHARLLDGDLA
jgi:hypothetical protein